MTKKQKLVVALLAVGDLVVFGLLCLAVALTPQTTPGEQIGGASAQLPTSTPTAIPTATAIPTWTPTPTPTPYTPPTATPRPLRDEEAALLDQTEREVSALRGLDASRSVSRWKITRAQLRRRYADTFVSDEWEEAARSLTILLVAFDFVPPDTDLLSLWQDSFSEGIAGFYLIETEEIFVVSDAYSLGATERVVFAHEFGHALQDQHFDLEALGLNATSEPGHADRLLAIQALIEGDAELVQEQYVQRYFSQADALELWQDVMKFSSSSSESIPRVITEMSLFPYTHGREFVKALYDRGGWWAVNDTYAAPPASTEQILHPTRYLSGDEPVLVTLSPLTDTLGGDWRLAHEGPVGELLLRLYLENRLGAEESALAVEGWGGDDCVVYTNYASGDTVLLLHVVWDTLADARQFLDAYVRYADARFGHTADQTADGLNCWQGIDVLCVAWGAGGVTVALGPDQTTVDGVLAAGLPE